MSRSFVRVALVVVTVLTLAGSGTVPATAADAHGYCHLRVRITFTPTTKLKSITKNINGSPAYSISVEAFDPTGLTTDTPKECVVPINTFGDPFPDTIFVETSVYASREVTALDLLSCEAIDTWGYWSQGWTDGGPSALVGTYGIAGTWGNWMLTGDDGFLFQMAMPLTFEDPADAVTLLPKCTDSSTGVTTLSLVGVQAFHDGS